MSTSAMPRLGSRAKKRVIVCICKRCRKCDRAEMKSDCTEMKSDCVEMKSDCAESFVDDRIQIFSFLLTPVLRQFCTPTARCNYIFLRKFGVRLWLGLCYLNLSGADDSLRSNEDSDANRVICCGSSLIIFFIPA